MTRTVDTKLLYSTLKQEAYTLRQWFSNLVPESPGEIQITWLHSQHFLIQVFVIGPRICISNKPLGDADAVVCDDDDDDVFWGPHPENSCSRE